MNTVKKHFLRLKTFAGKKRLATAALAVAILGGGGFFAAPALFSPKSFVVSQLPSKESIFRETPDDAEGDALVAHAVREPQPRSPLTGRGCANPLRRPLGVMLADDLQARPLSGISRADIVVEMPVITGSMTRLLAMFGCEDVDAIGSIRSARDDFIPLASAFDALYAHWGGSHFALESLRKKVIDNIDALINPHSAFYRKKGIPAPHNGFSSTERLYRSAELLGYRLTGVFEGYPRLARNRELESVSAPSTTIDGARHVFPAHVLDIGYVGYLSVEWRYAPEKKAYLRFRGGSPELDANNNEQVSAENVAVMHTRSIQIEGQYNDIRVAGEGAAEVYRRGERIEGRWKKEAGKLANKLFFLDKEGKEIPFAEGKLWIEIVDQTIPVSSQEAEKPR